MDSSLSSPAIRFARSVQPDDRSSGDDSSFFRWWQERRKSNTCTVSLIPFAEMDQWSFSPSTGNLAHNEGHFFTVEGLRLHRGEQGAHEQPIINQPEIGLLGILVKEFDGILHCLMQAKVEPGNLNTLQLSPTVQATRSNYTRRHRGQATRYLEYFTGEASARVLVDVLQSEQGRWFWHKRNRNMIVEALEEVTESEDHRWLPLGQVLALLRVENLVNMDARTVLGCIPFGPLPELLAASDPFRQALARSYAPDVGRHAGAIRGPEDELLSWLIDAKVSRSWNGRLIPLGHVEGWSREPAELGDHDRKDFRIVAARIEAHSREVAHWTQPLLAPRRIGLAALLVRPVDGVLRVLAQARPEPGLRDVVELGPSVQVPDGVDAAVDGAVPFLEEALTEDSARVRFDTVLSEEGGRFYHAQTRYRVIELPPDFPMDVPSGYRWLTARQLMSLVQRGHHVNIEARSLLACLHGLW